MILDMCVGTHGDDERSATVSCFVTQMIRSREHYLRKAVFSLRLVLSPALLCTHRKRDARAISQVDAERISVARGYAVESAVPSGESECAEDSVRYRELR